MDSSSMNRIVQSGLLLGCVIGLAGCLYADYGEVEDGAPIGYFEPGDYSRSSGFGRVLRSYLTENTGPVSRVVGSAGEGSPHAVFDVWSISTLGSTSALFDGCDNGCETGSGADFVGIGDWREERGCLLISSLVQRLPAEDGFIRLQCETDANMFISFGGPQGVEFGRSMAPLESTFGVAIIGAPGDGAGSLHTIARNDSSFVSIPVPAQLGLTAGARLGDELASFKVGSVGELSDASVVLAAAPGMQRVVAFVVGLDSTSTIASTALGCIDGVTIRSPTDAEAVGGSFAMVDTNGDGVPEALIGDPLGNRVLHVPLNLEDGAGCETTAADMHPGTQVFTCADFPADERVSCAGLGSSVAGGDFDADGDIDLVLGASASEVDNNIAAGALYILENDAGFDPTTAHPLTLSSPSAEARLGTRVVIGRTLLLDGGRDEPIASAPGNNRLYSFYCTGLAGDSPINNDRCLSVR